MCIGGEEMFLIRGDSAHFFNWEQYGLRITVLEGTLSPTDTCEVSVRALVGGGFQLPEDTELISAVYSISVSKPLLKQVILEIQHCADVVTQDHTSYLSFAKASVNTGLPYQFNLVEGGQFHTGDQYGSICLSKFSLWAIIKFIKRCLGYPTSSESSSDDELLFEDTQEYRNEVSPAEGILSKIICHFMNFLFVDNSISYGVGAIDRTKSLTPSSSTDNKPSSVDISTSSLEHSPQLPHSSTLPSKQSQTKGRLIVLTILTNVPVDVSKAIIDNKYVAQIVYEVKCPGTKWLMHFVVAKHLNALLEVSKH